MCLLGVNASRYGVQGDLSNRDIMRGLGVTPEQFTDSMSRELRYARSAYVQLKDEAQLVNLLSSEPCTPTWVA